MNQFREETKFVMAETALEVARVEGDRVLYQDRAYNVHIWLWAIPGKEVFSYDSSSAVAEQHIDRTFTIPRQKGCACLEDCRCESARFPPEGLPSANAQIYYHDKCWSVKSWPADSVGAAYQLQTTAHFPRRINVR